MKPSGVFLPALSLALWLGVLAAPVQANWLSSLAEIAANSGKIAGKTGRFAGEITAGLESAVRVIGKLPAELQKSAIAAEALDGGAWRLRNAAGETITATSADGVRGALAGLGGDASSLTFYISQETAFAARESLSALPADIKLTLAVDDATLPLLRQGTGDTARMFAELNDGVLLAMTDPALFAESLWQLQRPLGKTGVRVLSLDTAGPKTLATLSKRGPEGMPLAEPVDPTDFASALASARGQTVIVTGQVEAGNLRFAGVSGGNGSVAVDDLLQAAERSDVNILLLDSGTPRQPGGTTWLWRERGIAHLDSAMAKATLGDFITALSRGQGRLTVGADWGTGGHFRLSAKPAAADAPAASAAAEAKSIGETTIEFAVDLAAKIAEHAIPQTTTASLNSRNTQWDLDNRVLPGIPAWLQAMVALSWLMGLIAVFETRRWWAFLQRRITGIAPPFTWPGRVGSEALYWLLFAPLLGWLTFDVMIIKMVWAQIAATLKLLLWPFRRLLGA